MGKVENSRQIMLKLSGQTTQNKANLNMFDTIEKIITAIEYILLDKIREVCQTKQFN